MSLVLSNWKTGGGSARSPWPTADEHRNALSRTLIGELVRASDALLRQRRGCSSCAPSPAPRCGPRATTCTS